MIRTRMRDEEIADNLPLRLPLKMYQPLLPHHDYADGQFVTRNSFAEDDATRIHQNRLRLIAICDSLELTPVANVGALLGEDASFFYRPLGFKTDTGDVLILDAPCYVNELVWHEDLTERDWSYSEIDPALFGLQFKHEEQHIRISTPGESKLDIDDTAKTIANTLAIFNNY